MSKANVVPGYARPFIRFAISILVHAYPVIVAEPAVANEEPSNLTQGLPCQLKRGMLHTVTGVIEADTLRLDDARLVRLVGALPPLADTAETDWPPLKRATEALTNLVLGRSVRLYYPQVDRDRYGRTLAHVVLEAGAAGGVENKDEQPVWVQEWLIRNGHARAQVLPGNAECASALIAYEIQPRQVRRGIWSLAAYQPQPSWAARRLSQLAGTFQLIEGRVTSIGTSRGNLYLNFGRHRGGFSVFVPATIFRGNPTLLRRLKTLKRRRIRVRGWIELRNGPFIEVAEESQIELLDERP